LSTISLDISEKRCEILIRVNTIFLVYSFVEIVTRLEKRGNAKIELKQLYPNFINICTWKRITICVGTIALYFIHSSTTSFCNRFFIVRNITISKVELKEKKLFYCILSFNLTNAETFHHIFVFFNVYEYFSSVSRKIKVRSIEYTKCL